VGRVRKFLVAGACAATLAVVPGAALATPPSGVTAEVLATGNAPHGIKVKNRGDTDVTVRVITIQPGGTTGSHYHDGPLIAVVKSGTLTRTLSDCSTEVSHAGDSFVEPHGHRAVHEGRNLGTEPVVLYVTYVLPKGSPFSEDAEPLDCDSH
jgi:quercetin dioxygenase-like cupin family protein